MKKVKNIVVVLLAFLLTALEIYAGGGVRNGTAGAVQLLIPVGPRGMAMGRATLTNSYGVESIYFNPANLAKTNKATDLMFTHMNYIADIGVSYGAVGVQLGEMGTVALSIKSLNVGDIKKTTEQFPDGLGSTYSPSFYTVGLTYAKPLSDRISVGLTANFVSEKIDQVNTSGIAFNVGISYDGLANIEGLSLGFVIKNLGPQMKFEGSGLLQKGKLNGYLRPDDYYKIDAASFELPSTLEIGMGYKTNIDNHNFIFNASFQNNNFYADEYHIGAEYGYDNLIFARAGYTFAPTLDDDDRTEGLAAGFGLKYDAGGVEFKVDYTFLKMKYFDNNHVIGVSVGL